jgi:ABC-type transport system substrate-binding protein
VDRRDCLAAAAACLAGGTARAAAPPKTLRTAFNFAETGFDPVQVSDLSSNTINAHIFESPLTYDHLARPALLKPQTAAALPEVSADFRRFVFTLRPGIFFADDPVFQGRPRELTAADHVYSIKRFYDPALKTEHLYQFENAGLLGLSELRRQALAHRTPFPYDAPVDGLRVLDRYRFEVRLARSDPRFVHLFATPQYTAALAREVVEAYGADLMAHPVGTGPFVLDQWRRGSFIRLRRNPRFREQHFHAEPAVDDAAAQQVARHLQGRRLPLLDSVEISIIDEAQPRWLAFAGGELDVLELPAELAAAALPGGRLAPNLARRGVQAHSALGADVQLTFFNFDDPAVGGYTPDKVALRRAVALAYDNEAEIRLVRGGQAIPAQSLLVPHTYGYDPALQTDMSQSSLARASALLDVYGYLDRDGDGWREHPDGRPLVLRLASLADQRARAINELWKKRMDALGVRMQFEPSQFGELIRRTLAGQLMMWSFAWTAGNPDGDFFLGLAYGPNAGQSNDARFRLAAFDRAYERQRALPDGPARLAAMREATHLMLAYLPYIAHHHRIVTDLSQPRVRGYLRHPFTRDWWRYADLAGPSGPAGPA